MSKVTITNMVFLENGDEVLVLDRIKKYIGISFPGGHIEKGESIYDSAIREFYEETGYVIKNLKSKGMIYWDALNGDKYFTHFFITSDFSGVKLDETDEGKVFWVNKSELSSLKLAPAVEYFIEMYLGDYIECYAKEITTDKWEVIYR